MHPRVDAVGSASVGAPQAVEELPDPRVLSLLTTEHFTLQGARAATISEGLGRASLSIGAISSTLVALGFVAQATRVGAVFYTFAFIALPTVLALGVFTFVRAVDVSIEDLRYARAINRIRGRYLQLAGSEARFFMLSGNDDVAGALRNMGIGKPSRWQLWFTLASMLLLVDCVLAGTTAALVVARATATGLTSAVGAGVAVAFISGAGHVRWQHRRHTSARDETAVLFPSSSGTEV